MEIHSKYLKTLVEAEEKRIQREIVAKLYSTFRSAGYRVSVSHDSQNETEKSVNSVSACLKAVFESDYDSDRCWMFAAKNGMKAPLWVFLVLDNVEDIISDYGVSAESLVAAANETANKYQ